MAPASQVIVKPSSCAENCLCNRKMTELLHTAQYTCDLKPFCMVKLLTCHAAQSRHRFLLRATPQRRWMQRPTVFRTATLQAHQAAKQQAHTYSLSFWESSPVSVTAFMHSKYTPLLCSHKVIHCSVWVHWPMIALSSTQIMNLGLCASDHHCRSFVGAGRWQPSNPVAAMSVQAGQ